MIPWPSLFGTEDARLREEDIVNRRRSWTWRFYYRVALFFGGFITLAFLYRLLTAPAGTSICEAMLDNKINIEHACDLSCACTTCHVIVREGFNSLNELDESEEDLLDRAWGLEPNPRLSCQAFLAQGNVTVEIPKYSINHAKENH